MSRLTKKSKLFFLFFFGFLVGIFLEIILIENGKITFFSFQGSLEENVNISCLVLIKHHHTRYLNSSKKTWLKHCTNYNIVNIQRPTKNVEKSVPKTSVGISDSIKFQRLVKNYTICSENDNVQNVSAYNAWAGLCKTIRLISPTQFQWLIIIPDSLVVLVENLKHFVKNLNSDEGHYYGYTLKNYQADYNVLSAGILLSRGAVSKLLSKFNSEEDCDKSGKYWKNEDLYLGKHLKQMNILPMDSRDAEGRGRFHGYNLNNVLWPGRLFMQSDYNKKALYPVSQGFNCCSPYLITVEVSSPDSMHNLYFFLYKLKTAHKNLPNKIQVNKTEGTYWKDFLRREGYSEKEIENMTNEEYYKIWEKKLPENKIYLEMQNFFKNNREELD